MPYRRSLLQELTGEAHETRHTTAAGPTAHTAASSSHFALHIHLESHLRSFPNDILLVGAGVDVTLGTLLIEQLCCLACSEMLAKVCPMCFRETLTHGHADERILA